MRDDQFHVRNVREFGNFGSRKYSRQQVQAVKYFFKHCEGKLFDRNSLLVLDQLQIIHATVDHFQQHLAKEATFEVTCADEFLDVLHKKQ